MAPAFILYLLSNLILQVLFPGVVEAQPGTVHNVFNVDCGNQFGFQTLALLHSLRTAGQPGPVTRVMSCTPEEVDDMDEETMGLVQTYITPSFAVNEETDDEYPPYNRPRALMMWMEDVNPPEEWILILDPDMVVRSPLTPSSLQVPEGFVSAAHCDYLEGCKGDLAEMHIPEVPKLLDENAGLWGRRCDEVGAYILMRMEDMKRVAPLWWQYSLDVREDVGALEFEKDAGNKDGEKPWIAEMYGYAFATAKLGLRHIISADAQAYTPYPGGTDYVVDVPKVLHYTYEIGLLDYKFTKRNYSDFNYTKCPSDGFQISDEYGLFPHPPHPSKLVTKDPNVRYLQLLGIELMVSLNQALCERHQQKCSFSAELSKECEKVEELKSAVMAEEIIVEKSEKLCAPFVGCGIGKMLGYCKTSHALMSYFCRSTCGLCMHGGEVKVIKEEVIKHEKNGVEFLSSEMDGMLEVEHSIIQTIGGNQFWWLFLLPSAIVLLFYSRKFNCCLDIREKGRYKIFALRKSDYPFNKFQEKITSIWRLRSLSRKQS